MKRMGSERYEARDGGVAAVTIGWAPCNHLGPEVALIRVLAACGLTTHIESVEGGPHLCRFVMQPRESWCAAVVSTLVEYDDCARVDALIEGLQFVFSKVSFGDLESSYTMGGTRAVAELVRRVALDSANEHVGAAVDRSKLG